jgi:hypothetical protein
LFPPFATFVSIFFGRVSFVHPNCLFLKLAWCIYRTHPTARRDSCGLQPPSTSGSTAPHTCHNCRDPSSIFSKKSNLYQLNFNSSWDFISIDEADIRYTKFCLMRVWIIRWYRISS